MSTATTVLVVDDSQVSRMMIRAIIEDRHPEWTIIEAKSGDEALSKCEQQQNIALMILDYNLPGMDGLTMAGHLKEKYPATPISLLTADIQKGIRDKAAHLNLHFTPKPITEDKVASILKLVK